nr:MAG TPA: hypothetical protein [Caudoviricetes sp.]
MALSQPLVVLYATRVVTGTTSLGLTTRQK